VTQIPVVIRVTPYAWEAIRDDVPYEVGREVGAWLTGYSTAFEVIVEGVVPNSDGDEPYAGNSECVHPDIDWMRKVDEVQLSNDRRVLGRLHSHLAHHPPTPSRADEDTWGVFAGAGDFAGLIVHAGDGSSPPFTAIDRNIKGWIVPADRAPRPAALSIERSFT